MTSTKILLNLEIELKDANEKHRYLLRARNIAKLRLKKNGYIAELSHVEGEISFTKNEIVRIKEKIETEALPTELYIQGFKLKESKHRFILTDRDGETFRQWSHSPALGELFDVVNELKACV